MRGAFANGQLYPAFPMGGTIRTLSINDATWTEYRTEGADLVSIQVPPVEGGRVVFTNTATHTDLEDGAAVTPLHLQRSWDLYPGQVELCFDRARDEPVRFFFAVADVLDVSVDLVLMRAAS